MIRLTIMYNLPPGTDEDEFLRWRLGPHQASNSSMPGVVRTDFAQIDTAWPATEQPRYRFVTIVEWPDRESFERGFYDPQVQAKLVEDLKRITDQIFLIGEVLAESRQE